MPDARKASPRLVDAARYQRTHPEALPPLCVGDHVVDIGDLDDALDEVVTLTGDGAPLEIEGVPVLVVMARLTKTAEDHHYRGESGPTVATANPEYPGDDRVVQVLYPQAHTQSVTAGDVRWYAFPRSRLIRVTAVHDPGVLAPADIPERVGGEA